MDLGPGDPHEKVPIARINRIFTISLNRPYMARLKLISHDFMEMVDFEGVLAWEKVAKGKTRYTFFANAVLDSEV
jgi:hypothetical protein